MPAPAPNVSTGLIAGRVQLPSGAGFAGASVNVLAANGSSAAPFQHSGADGGFAFAVGPGVYVVHVSAMQTYVAPPDAHVTLVVGQPCPPVVLTVSPKPPAQPPVTPTPIPTAPPAVITPPPARKLWCDVGSRRMQGEVYVAGQAPALAFVAATLDPADWTNNRYVVESWGDGSDVSTRPQREPLACHLYAKPGDYTAQVREVRPDGTAIVIPQVIRVLADARRHVEVATAADLVALSGKDDPYVHLAASLSLPASFRLGHNAVIDGVGPTRPTLTTGGFPAFDCWPGQTDRALILGGFDVTSATHAETINGVAVQVGDPKAVAVSAKGCNVGIIDVGLGNLYFGVKVSDVAAGVAMIGCHQLSGTWLTAEAWYGSGGTDLAVIGNRFGDVLRESCLRADDVGRLRLAIARNDLWAGGNAVGNWKGPTIRCCDGFFIGDNDYDGVTGSQFGLSTDNSHDGVMGRAVTHGLALGNRFKRASWIVGPVGGNHVFDGNAVDPFRPGDPCVETHPGQPGETLGPVTVLDNNTSTVAAWRTKDAAGVVRAVAAGALQAAAKA